MARFYGEIGFGDTVEIAPGVWEDVINERKYMGNVLSNAQRFVSGESVNNNITLNHSISVVADAFAFAHLRSIRYIRYEGELWELDRVEVQRPRLILSLGGVYNGPTSTTPNAA